MKHRSDLEKEKKITPLHLEFFFSAFKGLVLK